MPIGGGGGAAFPAQWTVDHSTGGLTLDLTLPTDAQEHDALAVKINSAQVFRVFIGADGDPQVTITDLNLSAIWRNEELDSFPTLQVIGEGEIRSRSLPTADPHVSGQLWNSAGTMMISAG